MPSLIKDGAVVSDDWSAPLLSVEELAESAGDGLGVAIQPGDDTSAVVAAKERLALVVIDFPVFTDGRGFSYARELREAGFGGEIRARGQFLRDQLFYLKRCGFNAFQFEEGTDLEACLPSLDDFSEAYQAAIDEPNPLFRRRA